MGTRTILTRRQVMEICKAVFNFEEYGIKPYLKDIKCDSGRRRLSYYIEDSELPFDDEYKVEFSVSGIRLMLSIYKVVDINKLSEVELYVYHIDRNDWILSSVYRSYPERPIFSGVVFGKDCIYLDNNSPSELL